MRFSSELPDKKSPRSPFKLINVRHAVQIFSSEVNVVYHSPDYTFHNHSFEFPFVHPPTITAPYGTVLAENAKSSAYSLSICTSRITSEENDID
jgi:hypothetical protein